MDDKEYVVIGVHAGKDASPDGVYTPGVPDNKIVARVRMNVDGRLIDEDLVMPRIITIEEQIDEVAKKRIAELKSDVKPADSILVEGEGNQTEVEHV